MARNRFLRISDGIIQESINRIIMDNPVSINPAPSSPELLAIEEKERAIALLSFLPETKSLTIYCCRTGEPIANMNLLQQAGKVPYLTDWKKSQAFHPLFSLPQAALLSWTRNNWKHVFRGAKDDVSITQKRQFQIAFLAILHSLNCIDQQHPALPSFDVVNTNMQRLLELSYWYNYLDSARFKFPTLRINKLNANLNLSDIHIYLDICDSVRADWETSKERNVDEELKIEAARKAERAVRGACVRTVSKKHLWNWLLSHLTDKKYQRDEWVKWKTDSALVWFASESAQLKFTVEDVDHIEEVFLRECSMGNTVSHAFTEELNKIRNRIHGHRTIFSIDWIETAKVNAGATVVGKNGIAKRPQGPVHPGNVPPDPNDYPGTKRWMYLQAKAKYDIAIMQYDAWVEKYGREEQSDETETPPDIDESSTDSEDNDDDQASN